MKLKVCKLFIDYEKEELWLNDMASKGYNLVDYTFVRYLFEEGKRGEYIYRIELLNNLPSHPESRAYIRFMEEAGIECVATYVRWVYFRKKAEDGPFDLYSDYASRISHYNRLLWLMGSVGLLNILAGLYNLIVGLFLNQRMHFPFNAYVSVINLVLGIVIAKVFYSYCKRKQKLKYEHRLRE